MEHERTPKFLPNVLGYGCGLSLPGSLNKRSEKQYGRYPAYLSKYLLIPIFMAQLSRVLSLCTHIY